MASGSRLPCGARYSTRSYQCFVEATELAIDSRVQRWTLVTNPATMPPTETPPQQADEVRLSTYLVAVRRRWYVVVATVLLAMGLAALHTIGPAKRAQAAATVSLGAPLTPGGGGTASTPLLANPTAAKSYVQSGEVMARAAKVAGRPVTASLLRDHTSVTLTGGSQTKTSVSAVTITTQGPWPSATLVRAVAALGDSLIAYANRYPNAKNDALGRAVVAQRAELATLHAQLLAAKVSLRRLGRGRSETASRALAAASLRATLATTASRIDEISFNLTGDQIAQASIVDAEPAGYLQPPSGSSVTAASRTTSLLVASVLGVLVGCLIALAWDALVVRHATARSATTDA